MSYALVITMDGTKPGPRRRWLRPRLYLLLSSNGNFAHVSPSPFEMEWRPVPDPDRACMHCGTDCTGGGGWRDPKRECEGFHCIPCRDSLHPYVPSPALVRRPSRPARLIWRARNALKERADSAYLAWCHRFGRKIWQEPPPEPEG